MMTEQVVGQARSVIALCAKSKDPDIRDEAEKMRANLRQHVISGTRLVSKNIIHTLSPRIAFKIKDAETYGEKKEALLAPQSCKSDNLYYVKFMRERRTVVQFFDLPTARKRSDCNQIIKLGGLGIDAIDI